MRPGRPTLPAALALATTLVPAAATARVVNVGPADDYCAAINAAMPGDEVVLAAGMYTRPCAVRVSGRAGMPVLVRSAGEAAGARAVFAYPGTSANVLELYSVAFVTLRALEFGRTANGVDAIKIRSSTDVTVERCVFNDVGGVSIGAQVGDSARITVRDNALHAVRYTPLYIGCHDGTCRTTDVVIERNLIDRVTPHTGVGYGMEVKLNSYGVVRDNTVYGTAGPCIEVYGASRAGTPATIVEGNYADGSANDAAINVGGGPAIVRNNVAVRGRVAGIWAQDYGGRGLQQGVVIAHNTILENTGPGIQVQNWAAGRGNVIAFNAVAPRSGVAMLQPATPAATVMGNVDCAAAMCWERASVPYDLRPRAGGPLVGAAGAGAEPWRPADDFLGVARGTSADVGAFEQSAGALALGGGMMARPPRTGGGGMAGGDAGVDAGGAASDSGTSASDSGMGGVDGGSGGGADAGGGARGDGATSDAGDAGGGTMMRGGCGCGATPARAPRWGLVAVIAGAMIAGARRRRR